MSLLSTIRIAFLAAAIATPAFSQVQAFGGDAPRMAATRMLLASPNFAPVGLVCIQYGQPAWSAEHQAKLDAMKGENARLGKDYWTTLNTSCALTIGGTKVAAGSYYLGLKVDAEGAFHLLVISSATADAKKWAPWSGAELKADFTCPLTRTATATEAALLKISLGEVKKEAPAEMTFSIQWGKHQLAAPVVAELPAAAGTK